MLQPQLRKLLNLPLELVPLKRLSFLPAGLSFSPPFIPCFSAASRPERPFSAGKIPACLTE